MKYRFFIFLIFFSFFIAQNVSAISENDILLEKIRIKEEEIKKLEAEEVLYRQAVVVNQSQAKTLQGQISQVDAQIKRLSADLNITKAKISKTESSIKLRTSLIGKKEIEIKNRQLAMAESVRFLARLENQSIITILLKNNKLSDFLNWTRHLIGLEAGLYNNYKTLAQNKAELEDLLTEDKNLKKDLDDFKKEIIVKDSLVQNQKKEKSQLLLETKNQEKEYQKIISKLEIQQSEIQKSIFELENRLRGETLNVPPPRIGILAWPMTGRISQKYGPTSITGFFNHVYKFHNGVDIAAYYGTPIRSALDGIVAASGNNGNYAYGNWLAIRHNNGLTTLYAHLSIKTVSVGEKVSQSQIIGYEGSSGFVTGPHLHFTVYSSNTFRTEKRWFGILPLGGSIDPLDYLAR